MILYVIMLSLNCLNAEEGATAAKRYLLINAAELIQDRYFENTLASKLKSEGMLLWRRDFAFVCHLPHPQPVSVSMNICMCTEARDQLQLFPSIVYHFIKKNKTKTRSLTEPGAFHKPACLHVRLQSYLTVKTI